MHYRPPKLYAISDIPLSGLSHPQQVKELCEGGAQLVQLRDKHLSSAEFYEQALEALKVARSYQTKLLINDRLDIALAIGADGVHLGQDDLPASAVRNLLGDDVIVGLSTHSLAQIKAALEEPVDYIAIGPIFPTLTKQDAAPVVGLGGLLEIRQFARDMPLVAIGGVTLENAAAALSAGANSVAMISWLIHEPGEIAGRTRQALAALQNPVD